MPPREPYRLVYAPQVKEHLRAIERKQYPLIRRSIERQLGHQPALENRNRKPLKRHATHQVTWELRFGPRNRFRVFYDVLSDKREVHILAIGIKEGKRLLLGGREVEL